MKGKARFHTLSRLAVACLFCLPLPAQSTASTLAASTLPVFETASIRPASEDALGDGMSFMNPLERQVPPRGLLTMTSPLAPFIAFAYGIKDEAEARAFSARLPEWARQQKYTIVARPPQDSPTTEQIRVMLRRLLEDRFALKAHRESHTGAVSSLVMARAGVTGPGLKPHPADRACLERGSGETAKSPEPGKAASGYCGLDLYPAAGGMLHVSMIDVTLAEACTLLGGLGGVLGGRRMEQIVDATGLAGQWDITLDFLPERNGRSDDSRQPDGDLSGPTFTGALEQQLGLRLRKSTGEVEQLVIDHIQRPISD